MTETIDTQQSDAFIITTDNNLWETNIINQFSNKSNKRPKTTENTTDDFPEFLEPEYPLDDLAGLLRYNTWHKKSCQAVAEDGCGTKWDLVSPKFQKTPPSQKSIQKISEFINNLTLDIHKIFYRSIYDRRTMACSAIELIRDKTTGEPKDLYPLNVQYMKKHRDGCRIRQEYNNKVTWFIQYGMNYDENGNEYEVDRIYGTKHPIGTLPKDRVANEVFWFTEYAPLAENYGLANIVPAMQAVYGDLGRCEYNNKFFENYGLPAFAVTVTGNFKDYNKKPGDEGYDVTKTLRYKISQQIKEVIKNPHSAVTITVPSIDAESNVEVKIQPLSVDMKEASFRLYRSDNREEVAAANGVPLYRLGVTITGSLGGTAAEQQSDIYSDSVIQPIRRDCAEIINLIIRELFDIHDVKFKLDEYRKKDEIQELEIADKIFQNGGMNVGEWSDYFAKRFNATPIPEDSPLYNIRVINNTLFDEYGQIITSNESNTSYDALLDNLEGELTKEAEELEGENKYENNNTNTTTFNQTTPNGIQNTSNKTKNKPITTAIRRAFTTRKRINT